MLVFEERGKPEYPEKNLSEQGENQQQTQPTYDVDRGQTREICEKQEKYFKGKVFTSTVQSLILYQYPVDLLTFFELY